MMEARELWFRIPRPLRWGILLLGGASFLLFVNAYRLTYSDEYEEIPAEVWAQRDPRALREATEVSDLFAADLQPGSPGEEGEAGSTEGQAPYAVQMAGARFVDVVNRMGEGSILYHEVDAVGNLYLVMGAQWADLSLDHQQVVLNGLANNWQQYLKDTFGAWDGAEGFRPGIVLVDTEGVYAQVLNGEIKILRSPVY